MSINGLLEQARRRGMFVRLSIRTSRDGQQYEVALQARFLDGAGAKPLYRERFPVDVPVARAIDDVADMAVHFIGFTDAAHAPPALNRQKKLTRASPLSGRQPIARSPDSPT
jgi:hypothetical protein